MGFVISPLSLYERNLLPRLWRNTNACNQMVPLVEDKSFSCSFEHLLRRECLAEEQKNVIYYDGSFWTEALALFYLCVEVFSARFESIMFSFRWECSLTDSMHWLLNPVSGNLNFDHLWTKNILKYLLSITWNCSSWTTARKLRVSLLCKVWNGLLYCLL